MSKLDRNMIIKLQVAARGARAISAYSDAEAINCRILVLLAKEFGTGSIEYAQQLEELAEIYDLQQHWTEAERFLNQAAAIYRGLQDGSNQASMALVLRNLAEVCRHQHKIAEARQLELEVADMLSVRFPKASAG